MARPLSKNGHTPRSPKQSALSSFQIKARACCKLGVPPVNLLKVIELASEGRIFMKFLLAGLATIAMTQHSLAQTVNAGIDQPVLSWFLSTPKIATEAIENALICQSDQLKAGFLPASQSFFIEQGELVFFFKKSSGDNLTYEGAAAEKLKSLSLSDEASDETKIEFLKLAVESTKNAFFLMAYGMSKAGQHDGISVWSRVRQVYSEDKKLAQAKAKDLIAELGRENGKYELILQTMKAVFKVDTFAGDTLSLTFALDGQTGQMQLQCQKLDSN